jgi:hypothetical protein
VLRQNSGFNSPISHLWNHISSRSIHESTSKCVCNMTDHGGCAPGTPDSRYGKVSSLCCASVVLYIGRDLHVMNIPGKDPSIGSRNWGCRPDAAPRLRPEHLARRSPRSQHCRHISHSPTALPPRSCRLSSEPLCTTARSCFGVSDYRQAQTVKSSESVTQSH